MIVARWDPEAHIPLLAEWFRRHGKTWTTGDANLYPSTGFVVDQCAVGFLYTTNAPLVGYLDGFVTDPSATVRRRHRATKRLCEALTDEARAHGISLLCAATNVPGLVGIGRRVGFESYGSGYEYLCRKVV